MLDADALLLLAQLQQRVLQLEDRVRALEERTDKRATVPREGGTTAFDAHQTAERALMLRGLEATKWNRQRAADMLGISRRTFYRRMEEYGIQKGDTRSGVAGKEKARSKQRKSR